MSRQSPQSAQRARSAQRRHVVGVAVTEDLPVFELAVPCEVFGIDRADLADPWYELRFAAVTPGRHAARSGLTVDAPYPLETLADVDTLILPAFARAKQIEPPDELVRTVRKAHENGRRIVAICTGAYVLAAAGLLDGRRATTHWMNAFDFAQRYPAVTFDPDVLYTQDGDVFTSAGTGAAIDLCLHLVRLDHGAAVANEVARRMVVPPHRDGGQSQFANLPQRPRTPDTLAGALDWARERLDQPLTVADLARQARLSPRTFARRFRESLGTTPLQWLVGQRVRLAQELLETTDDSIERIAHRSGFGTPANLRTHFVRQTSVTPGTYRQVFHR
ncbi:GlxA family transcriptional regulator [Dactylosporangium fulvum]|uniref:Helix-turn-helix domain-containing protein n=1 Tax=Dactylosporangium fulvum TaxID=53359 RepID=A0ABY5W7I2_9ACTN|nr:helix-turn-helix domain-containing protein [Dactylosporangium fulvum]UWP86062.1 helix-turn-helix domain-containing protein [Dactylosporangium fulvum]